MLSVNQIAIIGTGLLGTSIALGLKRAGYDGRIVGVGRRRATLEQARATGGFDDATTDYADALAEGSLVVVAVPLGGFTEAFARIGRLADRRLIVTDVGSTKVMAVEEAARRLGESHVYVGSHPMAGSEQQGPGHARADLFEGKPCVIVGEEQEGDPATADAVGDQPDADVNTDADSNTDSKADADDNTAHAREVVECLWTTLGMTLLHVTAAEHDRQTAVVSHLPHLASVLLVEVAQREGGWPVASTGFRDTTRLASSNPPMRADIIAANTGQIARAASILREQLDSLLTTLTAETPPPAGSKPTVRDAMLTRLERAKQQRDQWLDHRDS